MCVCTSMKAGKQVAWFALSKVEWNSCSCKQFNWFCFCYEKAKEKASAGERVALICYVKGFVKLSERKRPKKKKRNKIVQAN